MSGRPGEERRIGGGREKVVRNGLGLGLRRDDRASSNLLLVVAGGDGVRVRVSGCHADDADHSGFGCWVVSEDVR